MTRDSDGAVAVIGCFGLIPIMLIGWMLEAWAVITLWGWFIYPTWHIATPSKQAAVGLVILVSVLCPTPSSSDRKDKSVVATITAAYAPIILGPPFAVLAGWCVRQWL